MNKSFKYNTILSGSPASVAADLGIIAFDILPYNTPNPLKINSFHVLPSSAILRMGLNSCGKNVVKAFLGSPRLEWPFSRWGMSESS